jgi:hypothetical protein
MSARTAVRIRHVITIALTLCALAAAPASAASTTRFASPNGSASPSECTDASAPCALPTALANPAADDTISLAPGSYDVAGIALPRVPLHWKATDKATRPVLTSANPAPTLMLGFDQSGTSFDGLEIDNTGTNGEPLAVSAGIDATVRSSVLKGAHCVDQSDGDQLEGELTIEDSTLSNPVGRTCARLGVSSILRRSVVTQTAGISTETPPLAVSTHGLVVDTRITGGLELLGTRAVARRVVSSGWTAIRGEGLVVDSVARASGSQGAAIAVDTPGGGTLRVVNATAISQASAALAAPDAVATRSLFSDFNFLKVTNTIAHGAPDLIVTRLAGGCPAGKFCTNGQIVIDHSNFASRQPAAGGGNDPIVLHLGNQTGDPLFANAAAGDFHLLAGSPAIDAGDDPTGRALSTDADGRPRLKGTAVDLGAFEFSPPPADTGGGGGGGGGGTPPGTITDPPADTTAPTLGRLHLSRVRFGTRAGTTLTATTSEAGQLRIGIQRGVAGRRLHGRCVKAKRAGMRCTKWTGVGPPLVQAAPQAGAVKLVFTARTKTRKLAPGRYRFVVTATDVAGNRSAPRTIAFTITRARARGAARTAPRAGRSRRPTATAPPPPARPRGARASLPRRSAP